MVGANVGWNRLVRGRTVAARGENWHSGPQFLAQNWLVVRTQRENGASRQYILQARGSRKGGWGKGWCARLRALKLSPSCGHGSSAMSFCV